MPKNKITGPMRMQPIERATIVPTQPANADCVIISRLAASRHGEFYDTVSSGIAKMLQIVEAMQTICARAPEPATVNNQVCNTNLKRDTAPRLAREPHRVGSFGALVTAMERNHHVDA